MNPSENTCTVYMEVSGIRHKFLTQSMPRTRRDTAASAREDTVQVVENERPCIWYTHQIEDTVTLFLMKTMQERTLFVGKVVGFAELSATAGWPQVKNTSGGRPVVGNWKIQSVVETSAIEVSCGSSRIRLGRADSRSNSRVLLRLNDGSRVHRESSQDELIREEYQGSSSYGQSNFDQR